MGTNVNIYARNGQLHVHRLIERLTPENQKVSFALMVELLNYGWDPNADGTRFSRGRYTALQNRQGRTKNGYSDFDQGDLKRLGVLLSSYLRYHLPPRKYPKAYLGEHALHIVVNRLDSENEGTTLEAVRLLVKFGTNVNIRDRNGQTALHRLLDRLTPDNQKTTFTLIVELLEHGGADPNVLDNRYESVLHVLINRLDSKNGETILEAVRLLVTMGTNVNIRGGYFQTLLHHLIEGLTPDNQKASFALIDELLKYGRDPNPVTYHCVEGRDTALSDKMLKLGVGDLNRDLELMLALVAKLLGHGANPLATEDSGERILESLYQNLLTGEYRPEAALALLNRLINCAIKRRGAEDRKTLVAYHYMATWLQMLTRKFDKTDETAASELVHTLLQNGVDLTGQNEDEYKRTSLHRMADWLNLVGHGLSENDPDIGVALVNHLLRLGVDPNAQDYRGATILHYITRRKVKISPENLQVTMRIVNVLYEQGMDLSTQDRWGRTALHSLITYVRHEAAITLATWLLDHGIDPHVQDKRGRTALHELGDRHSNSEWENQDMTLVSLINTLLEHGLDPHKQDDYGQTALHYMIKTDATPTTVTALLKGGADPTLLNRYGETPLHILVGRFDHDDNQEKTVALATCLFEHQVRFGQRPPSSFLVVRGDELRLITIEEDIDPTRMQHNDEMTSSLRFRVESLGNGSYEESLHQVIKYVERGADPRTPNEDDETVLQFIVKRLDCHNGNDTVEVVTKLLERGADPNVLTWCRSSRARKTCLHMLAEKSSRIDDEKINIWKLLAVLLEHGADSTRYDSSFKLPFDSLVDSTAVFQWIQCMVTTGGGIHTNA